MNFVDFLNDLYVGVQDPKMAKNKVWIKETQLKKQAGYYDSPEVKLRIDEIKKSVLNKP